MILNVKEGNVHDGRDELNETVTEHDLIEQGPRDRVEGDRGGDENIAQDIHGHENHLKHGGRYVKVCKVAVAVEKLVERYHCVRNLATVHIIDVIARV
jgi:hypothetical protein